MVAIRSKPLPRRTFLRGGAVGAGVVIGLPILDAMRKSTGDAQAAAPAPARFISWFFGSGFDLNSIESRSANGSTINPLDALNPHLRHFSGVEQYLSVCSGLELKAFNPGADEHHVGRCGTFSGFTCVPDNSEPLKSNWGGPTIDQEIARLVDAAIDPAPIPSIQIGISKVRATDDDKGTTAQALSIRRSSSGTGLVALRPETNPKNLWKLLFGRSGTGGVLPPHKQSIIDFVRDDITRLNARLGQEDRIRLEAHLVALRQVEANVECASAPAEPTLDNSERNGSERIIDVNNVMAELVRIAFACDITRVVSVEFTKVAGDTAFWEAGPEYADALQHVESHREIHTLYNGGVDFTMARLSDWMFRLNSTLRDGTPLGDNFLDSTIIMASSDTAWGKSHKHDRTPVIIGGVGTKNGNPWLKGNVSYIPPGAEIGPTENRNLSFTAAGNVSEVALTILRGYDPAAAPGVSTSFGDLTSGFPAGAQGEGVATLINPAQLI